MSFLKRWRASPKKLCGPDVAKAPVEILNLAGVLVNFKKPPHTAEVPIRPVIKQFDMHSVNAYEGLLDNSTVHAEALLRTGWSFFSGISVSDSIGSLMLHIAINKTLEENGAGNSLFETRRHIDFVCQISDKKYSKWNGDMLAERNLPPEEIDRYKDQHFFQYPKTKSDIEVININNVEWLKYSAGQPGYPHRVFYRAALGHSNSLSVSFKPSRHLDDYFSPDTNLPEVVEKTINDIMNTMEIRLSPEAEQQRREVLGDVK